MQTSCRRPFKALQMGNVWRADRPQRGRYRQFMQCDIDILGEASNLAEIELILATSTLLGKLDFQRFHDPDQRQTDLKGHGSVQRICRRKITIPSLSRWIRWTRSVWKAWQEELEEDGYAKESVEKYLDTIQGSDTMIWTGIRYLKEKLWETFWIRRRRKAWRQIMTSVECSERSGL